MPDNPTPTREEVAGWLATLSVLTGKNMTWREVDRACARAALAMLTEEPVSNAYTFAPEPANPCKWVDIRNQVIESGECCYTCGLLSAGNDGMRPPCPRAAALASNAPDPWGEGDARDFDADAAYFANCGYAVLAARHRRAAQRARGQAVTEDGR